LAVALLSCNPFGGSPAGPASSAPPDTHRIVTDRYPGGASRHVETYVGDTTGLPHTTRTFSPSGALLKAVRHQADPGSRIAYYDDLHPRFDSAGGVRSFLQGTWKRTERVTKLKRFSNGEVARVRTKLNRTFKGDTLIMTRIASVFEPETGRRIGVQGLEVGFDVEFLPDSRVRLQEVLYRRRPDTSQVLSDTLVLPPRLRNRVVDTLRVLAPHRFRVMTAVAPRLPRLYKRQSSLRSAPGELPDALQAPTPE
jgi:hypothetical protein